jgi:ABC-type transport system involved in multi-copper enzyme maturation permease subunit
MESDKKFISIIIIVVVMIIFMCQMILLKEANKDEIFVDSDKYLEFTNQYSILEYLKNYILNITTSSTD